MQALDDADRMARAGFTYTPDDGPDRWRSHYDDVLAGRDYEDDCDGLGSTFLDLLHRHFGMALEDLYQLVVDSKGKGPDHFVGCAYSDNDFHIGGDTFYPAVYRASVMQHKPVKYRRLSEPPDLWREGAPFGEPEK